MNYGYSPGRLRQIKYLLNRDGPNCYLCSKEVVLKRNPNTNTSPTIDHRIPRSFGGSSKLTNLSVVHKYCNKHIKDNGFPFQTEICENCGSVKEVSDWRPCHNCEFLRKVS